MTSIPHDYAERVYAGVLGKLIGVYLGRPFEGWTYERIMEELGPIDYYVNERRDVKLRSHHLVVTDDDVSGTFIFPRALADNGYPDRLSAEQVGQAWLNYIVEERSVLWWGGMGNSTEHTAYLRLKSGIAAPQSGSIALNGKSVAEQILYGALEIVSEKTQDDPMKTFKKAVGLNGVGQKAVNALAFEYYAQAVREGQTKVVEFSRGKLKKDHKATKTDETLEPGNAPTVPEGS